MPAGQSDCPEGTLKSWRHSHVAWHVVLTGNCLLLSTGPVEAAGEGGGGGVRQGREAMPWPRAALQPQLDTGSSVLLEPQLCKRPRALGNWGFCRHL